MSDCPYDLRDYAFDELTPSQRAEVERYLESSSEAREELERLRLTQRALLSDPEEEIPRRIAFVSDKVFEPSMAVRLWREFWTAAPRVAFGSAALLLAVFAGLWFTKPSFTVDQNGWQVAFNRPAGAVVQQNAPQTAEWTQQQIREAVAAVLAEQSSQQREAIAAMIDQVAEQQKPWQPELNAVKQEVRNMRQDMEASYWLLKNNVETLYRMRNAEGNLASAGRED